MSDFAVIYARFSPRRRTRDGKTIEQVTIDSQIESCVRYCQTKGWTVIGKPFTDEYKSGSSTNDREGLKQALELVKKTKATLVVLRLSRLSRSVEDSSRILSEILASKSNLASVTEDIDTTTPIGRVFFNFLTTMNQFNREVAAEQTSEVMLYRQANGEVMTRSDKLPFGCMVDPNNNNKWVDCPEEIEIAKLIINKLKKNTASDVVDYLNKQGMFNRGAPWNYQKLNRVRKRFATLIDQKGISEV